MNKEEWRDIPEYEGLYQVSNRGQVRSLDKYVEGKGGVDRLYRGKILKLYRNKRGDIVIGLYKDRIRKKYKVHRLVLTAFDRPPKDGEQGRHIYGDRGNNVTGNLKWCTPEENVKHNRVKFGNT